MNRQKNGTIVLSACVLFLFCVTTFNIEAKIVFCVDGDIFVMNDDGTSRRRLTRNTTTKDSYPRWAPDGNRIAFTRYMDREQIQTSSELFIMNADGTEPQRLTQNNVIDHYLSWSPDGQHIAFTSARDGSWGIFVIKVATLAVTKITGIEDDSAAPDWSPDGTRLTFERFLRVPGISPKTIYVMSANGQHPRPILPHPEAGDPPTFRFFPRWSADGQKILFYEVKWFAERDKRRFFVQRLGGRKQEITDIHERLGEEWMISGACWMEKDRAMLFSIKRLDKPNPNYDIYRYTFDKRGLRRITREPGHERWPDWIEGALSVSPDGKSPTQWGEIKRALEEQP